MLITSTAKKNKKIQVIAVAMLVAAFSFSNIVSAEPANCQCDCHKNMQNGAYSTQSSSNVIDYPGYSPVKKDGTTNSIQVKQKYAMSDLTNPPESVNNNIQIRPKTSTKAFSNTNSEATVDSYASTNTPLNQTTTNSTAVQNTVATDKIEKQVATSQATVEQPTQQLNTQETKLQTQQAQVTKTQPKVHFGQNVSDSEGNSVVNALGRKLVKQNGIDKQVYFTYSTKENVDATTNLEGTVTVYKGIMGCCENEDELAFVIGHELSHADNYHVAKGVVVDKAIDAGGTQAKKLLSKNISSKINKFGLASGSWSDTAVDTTQALGSTAYSRAQEKDADLTAIDYMVKCGYNPLAGISILNKINVAYPDLFADHPSTDKRIISIYNYVKQKYPKYLKEGYNTASYKQAYETYIQ